MATETQYRWRGEDVFPGGGGSTVAIGAEGAWTTREDAEAQMAAERERAEGLGDPWHRIWVEAENTEGTT
jgi:hypothetical protein